MHHFCEREIDPMQCPSRSHNSHALLAAAVRSEVHPYQVTHMIVCTQSICPLLIWCGALLKCWVCVSLLLTLIWRLKEAWHTCNQHKNQDGGFEVDFLSSPTFRLRILRNRPNCSGVTRLCRLLMMFPCRRRAIFRASRCWSDTLKQTRSQID